jgi:repressor of nif and glnA expression
MAKVDSREVEREKLAILRVLGSASGSLGSQIIARRLRDEHGIELSERAVRYHLGLLDEQGLTNKVSRRSGRSVTSAGLDELSNALVTDKVGFVSDKIDLLAYQSNFDVDRQSGFSPVNISFFQADQFKDALKAMTPVFKAGICVSDKVAVAEAGGSLGGLPVPEGYVGLATVCSIVVNGALLKAGVPMDSRFGGTLQYRQNRPWRFSDLIHYSGSSLDPSEIFIASRMTAVAETARRGAGKILANFREVPAMSLPLVRDIMAKLERAGIRGLVAMGESGKPVCEVPVNLHKIGLILSGGLNPVAAAAEGGIGTRNRAMSGLMDFRSLQSFWDVIKK